MAIRYIYPGIPHKFSIKLQTSAEGVTPIVFDNLETNYVDIICVFKGPATRDVVVKFSKVTKEGYILLKKLSAYEYQGVIESAITTQLNRGVYYLGVNFATTDTDIEDAEYNDAKEQAIIRIIRSKTDIGLESEIE